MYKHGGDIADEFLTLAFGKKLIVVWEAKLKFSGAKAEIPPPQMGFFLFLSQQNDFLLLKEEMCMCSVNMEKKQLKKFEG